MKKILKYIRQMLNQHLLNKKKIAKIYYCNNLRKIDLGASRKGYEGEWLLTDIDVLDITREKDWKIIVDQNAPTHLMAEHVWEHLTLEQAKLANQNCYRFLQSGGRLRIAVPDGNHPDPAYIEHVRVGGSGPGADDHKVLYTYQTLSKSLEEAGFKVELLEYWDEEGCFHKNHWDAEDGFIRRSADHDPRNKDGVLDYTSVIIDGFKTAKE